MRTKRLVRDYRAIYIRNEALWFLGYNARRRMSRRRPYLLVGLSWPMIDGDNVVLGLLAFFLLFSGHMVYLVSNSMFDF